VYNTSNPQANSIWIKKQSNRNKCAVLSAVGGALLLTGGGAFIYSFTF
jgi:hypothetical protein